MSYQPNVINKGDYVEINGTTFIAKKDFNRQRDNKLVLIPVDGAKPRYYVANEDIFNQKQRKELIVEYMEKRGLINGKRDK